ncbi:unnamed protein product [Protopolystoma xenopodis]|uniref:Uncharacterized protein n=1 Tax=Protopolystoma xenopodis TaxID=117903 RepID=A0A3S5FFT7_9PLAT|nr:unnamed protein product [Protopolystoma xenopodis]
MHPHSVWMQLKGRAVGLDADTRTTMTMANINCQNDPINPNNRVAITHFGMATPICGQSSGGWGNRVGLILSLSNFLLPPDSLLGHGYRLMFNRGAQSEPNWAGALGRREEQAPMLQWEMGFDSWHLDFETICRSSM